ncbi:MAG: sugar phosphate isomerase/epimerase [Spirochaetaceae bacterium]|jgi:D-psicose/D-tagatose/L-ribulose 3-epimerase|nr:sugar phosphate isomerase/epimerase [Spirochaetaceae bacterium]
MYRPVGIFYAYWTQEWDADFLPFVDKAKRLGFDLLELHAAVLSDRDRAYRLKVKKAADNAGILLSYGMGLAKAYDLSSTDEETRLRGVGFMKKIISAVGEMGGGPISGTVHSYWPGVLPEGAERKEPMLQQSLKSMRELAPFALDQGVALNVEVINRFEQFLLNTCAEALSYVAAVNSPACNILLDTFHMNIEEDSLEGAIRLAGPRLAALHLGEPNRMPPGTGRMPWAEIREALDSINFAGPLVMEPFVTPGGAVGRAVGVWRELAPEAGKDGLAEKAAAFVKQRLRPA